MITVTSNTQAIMPGRSARFLASGGTQPYSYAVAPDGAGGTIDPLTGVYQAPATLNANPARMSDTILVTDAVADEGSRSILIGSVFMLICDIIQREMGLGANQVYAWDQKINIPKDSELYVAVGVMSVKPFSNVRKYEGSEDGLMESQYANFRALISIDILSRSPAARDRKEEIVLALGSNYSQSQQEHNAFNIGKITSSFVNLSEIDGAAIPYRYSIMTHVLYVITKSKPINYYDQFSLNLQGKLLTETGEQLTTEDDDPLTVGETIEP